MSIERPDSFGAPLAVNASLTDHAARGAQWIVTSAGAGAILQMAIGVVLARLLTPENFGVMALAAVVIGAMRPVCDLGVGSAVVQRANLTERHVRSAFTFSVLLGVTVAAALMLVAPLAGALVRNDAIVPVLRVLATEFAIGGATVVAGALLRRRMDFRRIAVIDTVTTAVGYGAIAVMLAFLGYGVWSLVFGALAHAVIAAVWFFAVSPHSCWPLLGGRELRDLLRFGVGASVSRVVHHAALTADNFVVGRWLGAAAVGIYGRAYSLINIPHTFSTTWMAGVLFPALAHAQSDPARVGRAYLSVTQLTAMFAGPGMITLAIAAPHLLHAVYGPQWTTAAVPLQILCVAGYFRALTHVGGVVAQSMGRVYAELWRQAAYACLVVAGAVAGSRFGLPGVAAAVDAAIVFMFVALAHLALSATGVGWRSYWRVQVPAVVTAALAGACALPVRWLLESLHYRSGVITIGILAAAAVPSTAAALWQLGEPRFDRVRARLPRPLAAMSQAFRRGLASVL